MNYDTLDYIEGNIDRIADQDFVPKVPSVKYLTGLNLERRVKFDENARFLVTFFASDPYKKILEKQKKDPHSTQFISEEKYRETVSYCKRVSTHIPFSDDADEEPTPDTVAENLTEKGDKDCAEFVYN